MGALCTSRHFAGGSASRRVRDGLAGWPRKTRTRESACEPCVWDSVTTCVGSLKDDARDCSRLSCCAGNTQPTPPLESDLPSQPRLSVGRVGLQVQPIIEPVLFNICSEGGL
jgi:hypothetical protein